MSVGAAFVATIMGAAFAGYCATGSRARTLSPSVLMVMNCRVVVEGVAIVDDSQCNSQKEYQ